MIKRQLQVVPGPEIDFEPRFLEPGTMYLANEDRFIAGNFSEPLTEYARGWADPGGIKAALDFVAPEVVVSRRFEFGKAANSQAFLSEDDEVRAIGAPFKQVDYSAESETAYTLNKGLTIRADADVIAGNPEFERIYVAVLLARLYRNDFRRAVNALSAAAGNTAKTWDTSADPDADLLDLVISAEAASGVCNRVLIGQEAFRYRAVALRGQDHAGIASSASISLDQLALNLGVDEVRVSGHRYQSDTSTKTRIVPSIALAFYGDPEPTPNDASNCKCFVSPCADGGLVRVYREEVSAKLVDFSVEHHSRVIVTGTTGLKKLTVSGS